MLLDATLGFNDRPGFRFGAALEYKVWGFNNETSDTILSVPMILMDQTYTAIINWKCKVEDPTFGGYLMRYQRLVEWLALIGIHTLGEDYDWASGFEELLLVFEKLEDLDFEKKR